MANLEDINALLDGELTGEEKSRVLNHIQSDPQAQNEFLWGRTVKDCLRDKCPKHENPALFAVCMVRVQEIEKTRRTEAFVGRYAWAACVVVVATVFVGAAASRLGGPAELNKTNMASLFGGGLVAVPGAEANPQQVVEKAMGPLGCEVRPQGMAVREVAQGNIDGRKASRIRLVDGDGQLVLFVIQDVGGFAGQASLGNGYGKGVINGANAVSWSQDRMGYLLIGARPPESLATLADSLRAR
jgi:anti-sigma factor RsiW